MERYIKNKNNLQLGEKISSGSCSDIYLFKSDLLFKMFNIDYKDLRLKINKELLDNLIYLSNINLSYIITPIDIFRSKVNLYGYSMQKIDAKPLEKIELNTNIYDLINGFLRLKNDILVLSSNHVKTEDIGGDNILYNNNMYLIDLDLSLIDNNYDIEELYTKTCYNTFYSLLSHLVLKVNDNDGLSLERIKLKNGSNDYYLDYFNKLIDICSNLENRDVNTVSDIRKVYKKHFK